MKTKILQESNCAIAFQGSSSEEKKAFYKLSPLERLSIKINDHLDDGWRLHGVIITEYPPNHTLGNIPVVEYKQMLIHD